MIATSSSSVFVGLSPLFFQSSLSQSPCQHLHCTIVRGLDICCISITCFRFRKILGKAMAPQVPMVKDRRRLDAHSSTEDEQPRSGVKGITNWIDNLLEESNMRTCNTHVRIIAKQVPCQSCLFRNTSQMSGLCCSI